MFCYIFLKLLKFGQSVSGNHHRWFVASPIYHSTDALWCQGVSTTNFSTSILSAWTK
jgi:hypothetical protein